MRVVLRAQCKLSQTGHHVRAALVAQSKSAMRAVYMHACARIEAMRAVYMHACARIEAMRAVYMHARARIEASGQQMDVYDWTVSDFGVFLRRSRIRPLARYNCCQFRLVEMFLLEWRSYD